MSVLVTGHESQTSLWYLKPSAVDGQKEDLSVETKEIKNKQIKKKAS